MSKVVLSILHDILLHFLSMINFHTVLFTIRNTFFLLYLIRYVICCLMSLAILRIIYRPCKYRMSFRVWNKFQNFIIFLETPIFPRKWDKDQKELTSFLLLNESLISFEIGQRWIHSNKISFILLSFDYMPIWMVFYLHIHTCNWYL